MARDQKISPIGGHEQPSRPAPANAPMGIEAQGAAARFWWHVAQPETLDGVIGGALAWRRLRRRRYARMALALAALALRAARGLARRAVRCVGIGLVVSGTRRQRVGDIAAARMRLSGCAPRPCLIISAVSIGASCSPTGALTSAG